MKKYGTVESVPSNHSKFNSTRECLNVLAIRSATEISSHCFCKRACKCTDYTGRKVFIESKNKSIWEIYLYNVNPVIEIELIPDFPLEQYLGTFGGVLGLGGKLQFVFQLFAFLCILVGNRFVRIRQQQN